MEYIVAAIGGYFLGSIPFGLVLTKLAGYGDIRDIGSGNIGATNVLRTGNKKLALATLLLDGAKGAIAVLITLYFMHVLYDDCSTTVFTEGADTSRCASPFTFQTVPMLAGFCALLGHLYPVWLKFKGGKGVATTLGTYLALSPIVGAASCAAWLVTALVTRYSSLSALVAIAAAPFVSHFFVKDPNLTGLCGIVATLVFFKHRENVKRLVKGEEPKIGKKKQ